MDKPGTAYLCQFMALWRHYKPGSCATRHAWRGKTPTQRAYTKPYCQPRAARNARNAALALVANCWRQTLIGTSLLPRISCGARCAVAAGMGQFNHCMLSRPRGGRNKTTNGLYSHPLYTYTTTTHHHTTPGPLVPRTTGYPFPRTACPCAIPVPPHTLGQPDRPAGPPPCSYMPSYDPTPAIFTATCPIPCPCLPVLPACPTGTAVARIEY